MNITKSCLSTSLIILMLFSTNSLAKETWPIPYVDPAHIEELNDRFSGTSGTYHDESYKDSIANYDPKGDYLNWGKHADFESSGDFVFDENGLPQVKDGQKLYWNAVILCQYALSMHGKYSDGDEGARDIFLRTADKLIELQAPNGGFPYPSRVSRHNVLPDGWISAMAQGQALSVFSRALTVNNDPRYRSAGELAFKNLTTPVSKGGALSSMADLDPSLKNYVFFPEYPNNPVDYTLNGYMFTLLGIYDWSSIESASRGDAKEAFQNGLKTLNKILPYYDADGFSTYDMAHIVLKTPPYVAQNYMGIHVYLLHALNSIAPNPTLKKYERRWSTKIDNMNSALRFTKITVDSSPKTIGSTVKIAFGTSGGTPSDKLFKIDLKHNNEWKTIFPFTKADSFEWTPTEPGDYVLGFFTKNSDSVKDFDNFRNIPFTITADE